MSRLVRVTLNLDQSERLRFLQEKMTGRPPLMGMVRSAVDDWLDREFTRRGLGAEWAAERRSHLRVE